MIRGRFTFAAVLAVAAIGSGAAASASAPQAKRYIAFVRGGDTGFPSVWVADADGSDPRRIASGDQALISPNGAYVAIQHFGQGGAALELFSTAGRLLDGYFSAVRFNATALSWSANSRYLAVGLAKTSTSGGGALGLIDTSTLNSRLVSNGVISGASFNPDGAQLVFGMSSSQQLSSPVNLYTARAAGGGAAELTTDGHSFDPLWTRSGIVFDRSTLRGVSEAPIYQLWLDSAGSAKQLTHLKVPPQLDGLSPLAASADGNRLIAEYGGEDTSYAWTVQLSPLEVKPLTVAGEPVDAERVQGDQISANGRRLLVDVGAFEGPANDGVVESVGFGGGTPTKLTRGAQPSWSG